MISLITKPEWFIEDPRIRCYTPDTAPAILDFLMGHDEIAFDTEAPGLDVHTIDMPFCVQIGVDGYQIISDCRVLPITFWKELLETKMLIGVNLKYDLKHLFKAGIRPTRLEDLMINEILLTNGMYEIRETKGKFSFKGLSALYLDDHDVDKTIGAGFAVKPLDEPLTLPEVLYSAKDVINPLQIVRKQRERIIEKQIINVCSLENKYVIACADMEYNGFPIDTDKWKVAQQYVDEQLQIRLEALNAYAATTPLVKMKLLVGGRMVPAIYAYEGMGGMVVRANIVWTSPDQLLQAFKKLGVKTDTTDQNKLALLKDKHKIVNLFLEWNKFDGLKSKFMDKMLDYVNPVTGCVHSDIWQIVSTGRMSSNKPNLQQIPSKGAEANMIRNCFVPEVGDVFIDADLSSAELRIIAEGSQDPLWIQIYKEDGDLHSIICAKLFGIPLSDVKKPFPLKPDMTYRDVIKTINFGLAYGMTEYKLADTIGCSTEEAKKIISDYFKVVPKVKAFLDANGDYTRKNFVSYTLQPICRPRYFDRKKLTTYGKGGKPLLNMGDIERAGKNSPIQGTNADWIKMAHILIYDYIRQHNYPARVRMIIHDEVISSCPADKAEEWNKIQADLMEKAGGFIIKTIPVKADSKILECWKK